MYNLGAAGFIGLYIVEKLFERGYKVRAVVRDVKNEEKNKYLKALAPKPEQLELFEADLSANKYDEAFEGNLDIL
jgi:nucleoside-diphosphate-sugar epimerase